MAGSLRDQLVKAGLATSEQARKAERQARADKRAQHGRQAPAGDGADAAGAKQGKARHRGERPASATSSAKARARQLNAEKAERDRALAQAANDRAAEKAARAQIKQIILQNDQRAKTTSDEDVPYNFVHGKKVKRIYLPPAQREQLSSGSLVIVNNDGRYHLVSKAVAEQIRARDPKRIIAAHDDKPPAPGSDDEFYARFEVPDDLDW